MEVAVPSVQTRRWEGLAPLSGIVAVVLFIAAFIVHDVIPDTPGSDAPAADFSRYYQEEDGSIWFAGVIISLAIVFFFWFVGVLRTALQAAEGAAGRLAATAFGGGIAMAVLILASFGTQISAAILVSDRDQPISPESAVTFWYMGDGLFLGAFYAAAVLIGATGFIVLRGAIAPRWFGWLTLLVAFVLLDPWVNWAAFIFALPIWMIVISLLLWRQRAA